VFRCLALARQFSRAGCEVSFGVAPGTLDTVPQLGLAGFGVHELPPGSDACDLSGAPFDIVVLDLFEQTHEQIQSERRAGTHTVVLDDTGKLRPKGATVVCVTRPGRDACAGDRLEGPRYAIIDSRYRGARLGSLRRHRWTSEVRKVLVFFGVTDKNALTREAAIALGDVRDAEINLVLGRGAPCFAEVQEVCRHSPSLTLHTDLQISDMVDLCVQADLAFGACGGAAFERASLGLPSVGVVTVNGQRPLAGMLRDHGAAVILEQEEACADTLSATFDDLRAATWKRRTMTRRAALMCDGLGPARIVDHVLAQV
jgi:UDP-2,4-diacetamido-2,4,6-trideoxy-beta-L-altropyranose hydrolase